jgi:hypothetical protein
MRGARFSSPRGAWQMRTIGSRAYSCRRLQRHISTARIQICPQLLRPYGRRRIQHHQDRQSRYDPGHAAAHGALQCRVYLYRPFRLICAQVSQTMNAGTAAELKAFEAMSKKDHAGKCLAILHCSRISDVLTRRSQAPPSSGSTLSSTSTPPGRT